MADAAADEADEGRPAAFEPAAAEPSVLEFVAACLVDHACVDAPLNASGI